MSAGADNTALEALCNGVDVRGMSKGDGASNALDERYALVSVTPVGRFVSKPGVPEPDLGLSPLWHALSSALPAIARFSKKSLVN